MSSNKKKVRKLSDAEYNEYIAVLRNDAPLYNADGSMFVPGGSCDEEDEKGD
ncbi:MAG: hypothetical protein ACI4MS_04545 [Candidatus Coproplasma sp.]